MTQVRPTYLCLKRFMSPTQWICTEPDYYCCWWLDVVVLVLRDWGSGFLFFFQSVFFNNYSCATYAYVIVQLIFIVLVEIFPYFLLYFLFSIWNVFDVHEWNYFDALFTCYFVIWWDWSFLCGLCIIYFGVMQHDELKPLIKTLYWLL